MNYCRRFFSIFIIFLLCTSTIFAQTDDIKQIDSLMKSSFNTGMFNGNVLVAKHDKIIYSASFGFTDATKVRKLSSIDRFNIGSITKEFSAVALMQLIELGRLHLDAKVSSLIPELPKKWADEVSVKDLLQYTSGLPNVNWKKIKNDQDIFNDLSLIDTLDFKPGTNYDYNNNNIFLRQFIVQRLTGMPFKHYAEQFIFEPCSMNSSTMTPFEKEEYIANGFNNDLIADKKDLPITGGTYLTTADLLKWAKCLHSNKIINQQSLYELGQQFDLAETQSSLGVAKFKDKKLTEHVHDGRAGSYEAILVSDLNKKWTIILLSNNYHGKVFELAAAIQSIFKGEN